MRICANAKINLGLDVTGKREDGYHNVDMIMQELGLCDIIDITLSSNEGIRLSVDGDSLPVDEANIAYRAARLFFEKSHMQGGCDIHLQKHIPICAGLGGGSSDAAAVLKGLNVLTGYPLKREELLCLALSLGADVPFFIDGGCARAEGIGEILSPIDNKMNFHLALIKPDIDISTPKAYAKIDGAALEHPDIEAAIDSLKACDYEAFFKYTGNVFELVSIDEYEEIAEIKNHMEKNGAIFSMMSGSGPTVFGIFEDEAAAKKAYDSYENKHSGGVCRMV